MWLAGAPGFEPGDGGTKNRCLTAWRRPITAEARNSWVPYGWEGGQHNEAAKSLQPLDFGSILP